MARPRKFEKGKEPYWTPAKKEERAKRLAEKTKPPAPEPPIIEPEADPAPAGPVTHQPEITCEEYDCPVCATHLMKRGKNVEAYPKEPTKAPAPPTTTPPETPAEKKTGGVWKRLLETEL